MEACEYGLTRGTCFVAHRLEVVAVAGLLWISWCVLSVVGFRVFFPRFFYFERTRPTAMRPACLIYLSSSLISLSVCLSVCVYICVTYSSFLLIARAVRGRFPQTRDLRFEARAGMT